jgi:hypothetical protein
MKPFTHGKADISSNEKLVMSGTSLLPGRCGFLAASAASVIAVSYLRFRPRLAGK